MNPPLWVGTRKGLFRLRNAGTRWELDGTQFLGDPVTIVRQDPRDGSIYACLDHGHFGVKLHRSVDGGETFEECGVPEYPERPADADDIDPVRQKPLEWKLKLIWSLVPGGPDQKDHLWCGTIPGGLFHSRDAGKSWQLVESLWQHPLRKKWFGGGADQPGIHSICVHPKDSQHITLGVSCGGVWVSRDGGSTWECKADGMRAAYMPPELANTPEVQDPHCVVQCRSRPDHFWAQHHNGIFRSTDGCESWQEIECPNPSSFGFPVAVDPEDPDTAWFVPAVKDEKRYPRDGKFVVTRTRDGGKTFEVLDQGLPPAPAYDLVFRHALDIDARGQMLAMGSTTGNFWVSPDRGDRWLCVSQHLPPIYCVHFGSAR